MSSVIHAKARTHNHHSGIWVPAFAGTTAIEMTPHPTVLAARYERPSPSRGEGAVTSVRIKP